MIHVHIFPGMQLYFVVVVVSLFVFLVMTNVNVNDDKLNQSLIRNGRNLSAQHDHDEYSLPMLCIQC